MPVADADIIVYGSAVMPNDDVTQDGGGAIDLTKIMVFTRLGAPCTLEMLSGGADTENVTIYYLDGAGVLQSETKALNGVAVVAFAATMAVFLKAVKAGATANTVTIRKSGGGATIVVMPAAVLEARIPFYNAVSSATLQKIFHEKVFIKNTNGATALTSAKVSISADPEGVMTFGLAAAVNDVVANAGQTRLQAPAGITINAAEKDVPGGGTLASTAAIGTWLAMTLAAAASPFDSTFTLRLSGISG